MGYWRSKSSQNSVSNSNSRRPFVDQKTSGKLLRTEAARALIKESVVNMGSDEFYELEMAEVIDVILSEDKLPEREDGAGKDWSVMGAVLARTVRSEMGNSVDNLMFALPLDPSERNYPLRGENVVIVDYNGQRFYSSIVNLRNRPNNNISPGLSGMGRPRELVDEDWKFEYFATDTDKDGNPIPNAEHMDMGIRNLYPYQGDTIYQGRWGQSIRFGSNIIPESHEDPNSIQNSPNIIIRAGQLLDASNFNKSGYVKQLKDTSSMPVKEDINADGSSIWITTDQSVKLDIKGTNAVNHEFMTANQEDKQPKDGGKQIVLNSDRITFNAKTDRILGFAKSGIGFSTQKSFTVDADLTIDFNIGGVSTLQISDSNIIMQSPSNSGLSLSERVILSSPCPSILTLADYANITACEGAQLHLDDCAGIKDNQGSFLRVGGKALGITGYVFGRDDMGQQHLVYGEELTNLMDSICNSFVELGEVILNLTAIPTGAGPSGPVSGGPPNTLAVEGWIAGVETIRARLCDLLMKPEE